MVVTRRKRLYLASWAGHIAAWISLGLPGLLPARLEQSLTTSNYFLSSQAYPCVNKPQEKEHPMNALV